MKTKNIEVKEIFKIYFEEQGQDMIWMKVEKTGSFYKIIEIPVFASIVKNLYINKWIAEEDLEIGKPTIIVNPANQFNGFETQWKIRKILKE